MVDFVLALNHWFTFYIQVCLDLVEPVWGEFKNLLSKQKLTKYCWLTKELLYL